MTADLALLPAADLVKLFKKRKASPVEALDAALARAERFQPQLNCLQHVDAEGARKAAKQSEKRWRKGEPASPIDGVPTTIKDLVATAGMPTRFGSAATPSQGPWEVDAPSVAHLRRAGAVMFAKTTSPEYGWKGVTDSPLYGITRNPWDLERTPGGSSGGGTAAEAVGIGSLALGTDGAGSVRIPCAFTGLFGLKPTFGRVPLYPPSAMGSLSNAGPMTRTVRDAALMMNAMARPDPRDWYSLPFDDTQDYAKGLGKGVKGMRIAYSRTLGFVQDVDPEVAKLVDEGVRTLRRLGARIVEADPDLQGFDPRRIENVHWQSNVAVLIRGFAEGKRNLHDPGFVKSAEAGMRLSGEDVARAVQERQKLGVAFNLFFGEFDLLVTPTMPLPAFAVGEPAPHGGDGVDIGWTPFTLTFNLTRQPACTIPCGLTRAGLPVGLQIAGPLYSDALVLRAAAAFEAEMPVVLPPMATE